MVTYILPTFVSLFEGMSMPLPLSTQVLIFVVRTLKDPLTQLGIIALAILLYFLFNSAPARRLLDAAKFNSPVFSRYVKMYEWVIFCKLMSLLLRDGQDCSRAVSSAAEGAVNEVFRQRLAPAYAFSGDLSADLKKTGLFDDAFLWMVSMGGKTDDLSRTFATMGEYYQEEVLGKWSRLLKILRVVYTLMVGMLAGFCIFAMLIPLFSIVFHITSSIQYRW
jgi:type IV pilus assembly protein PilC